MGKTRNLFKKIRDTKGIFHAKMGTIKDRNGETDIENRLMDMGRADERVRCLKRVTWKLILPYVK